MKVKGGVLLAPKELEWIKCLNRNKRFSKKGELGDRQYKRIVERDLKHLPAKIDLFLEEINELSAASESKLKLDPLLREKILEKLISGASKFIKPIDPLKRTDILNQANEEANADSFNRINKIMRPFLYLRLSKINTHPGIIPISGDIKAIFDELDLDPDFETMKKKDDGSYIRVRNQGENDDFDKLLNLSDNELQSAVDRVIFGNVRDKKSSFVYWLIRKEHFDKQFLFSHSNRALKILERMKNKNLSGKGASRILPDMYKRGLINENRLSVRDVIENYQKNALKIAKECKFNKPGNPEVEVVCECIKNVGSFKPPKPLIAKRLQLTEYGDKPWNEIRGILSFFEPSP